MKTLSLAQRDIISVEDLAREEIVALFDSAKQLKKNPNTSTLKNKIIASCFFEASTRTRLSFETAVLRSGGQVIGFSDAGQTSQQKGEILSDTLRMVSAYADGIVIRHPDAGSAKFAAEISDKPVINAGDGPHQHPTQTLLDLFSIQECQGRLEGLKIGLMGDLRHARTIHSLAEIAYAFDFELFLIAPDFLKMPMDICQALRNKGVKFSEHNNVREVISELDILYITRLQKERFLLEEAPPLPQPFILRAEALAQVKKNFRILSPLPRREELPVEIDTTPYAYYFQQALNGVPVRQALLEAIFAH